MLKIIALITFLGVSQSGNAGQADTLTELQQQWARIKYNTPADQQEALFKQLSESSEAVLNANPDQAPYMIWHGIILSTYAGAKGGLGALSLVKEAKSLFEASIENNPYALNGSAYTSLGTLYYQVPGWPIGFGDEDKARENLRQALKINPDGIDSNYFYGDFLMDQGERDDAVKVLNHALAAEPRQGRELADKGRRAEIQALLQTQ